MDNEAGTVNASAALKSWTELVEQQNNLFTTTINEREHLRERVAELEQELSVWKIAYQTSKSEKEELKQKVVELQRSMTSMKDDNMIVVCLIDGDGHLFLPDLVTQGQSGGRKAAKLLIQGIAKYITNEDESALVRAQITITIFCNLAGLEDTYAQRKLSSKDDFKNFVLGFNQAAPLINIIDAGNGKEAADSKIKENLRVWSKFPQTARVIFGGAHDNGYTTTLTALENEGLMHKIVLLLGYRDIAVELQALELPWLRINDVFLEDKLPNKVYKKTPVAEAQNTRAGQSSSDLVINAAKLRARPNPPPCNQFYLSERGCPNGQNCKYGHEYILTEDGLAQLRKNTKKTPCPHINKGHPCPDGDKCLFSKVCPYGPDCKYYKQSKCKFMGKNAHKAINLSKRPNDNNAIYAGTSIASSSPIPPSVVSSDVSSTSEDKFTYSPFTVSYERN